jgi:DNA-binding transcriptional LysR family regulator
VLTDLDLNLLHALHALLDERHVTRAGHRVGLSQPAMSAALRRLRRYFDDDLLVRTGNTYRLTPMAEQLVRPLDQIMVLIAETLALRQGFDPSVSRRQFTIVLSDYALWLLSKRLMTTVEEQAPGVRVRFDVIGAGVESSDSGDLVIAPTVATLGAEACHLGDVPWTSVLADENPACGRCTLDQLSQLQYVQFQAGKVMNPADAELRRMGVELNIAAICSNFSAAIFMVGETGANTIAPRRLALRLGPAAGTRTVDCPAPLAPLQEHMHWSQVQSSDPGHRWLRERVLEVAGTI